MSHVPHTFSRIDYLIDNDLLTFAYFCEYQSIVTSDHGPVVLAMSFPDLPKAIRHWHFNSALLSDSDFLKFIEEQIKILFSRTLLMKPPA